MALPGAVTRRTEREAAELRAQGIDPASGAPIVVQTTQDPSVETITSPVTPTPTPFVVTPTTSTTDDPAALRARIAQLEQEGSTQSGRASSASRELEDVKKRLELVDGNRAFLEGQLSELVAKVGQLEADKKALEQQSNASQIDKVVADLNGEGPTEQQLKDFDADAVDMIRRITNQRLAGVVNPLVERMKAIEAQLGRLKELDKLPRLEESANVASMEVARSKELEFLRKEVIAYFPDFETVKDTKEWRDFVGQDIPGRGIKIGHLLGTYRKAYDPIGIRSVISAFYDKQKKPTLDSLVVPGKTNAEVPVGAPPAKIKASEYKAQLKAFTGKKLSLPDWNAFRTRWEQALAAGNVEMDTEIR